MKKNSKRETFIVTIFACFIGFLFSCHFFLIPQFLTPEGKTYFLFTYPDESGYFSVIRKAAEGNLIPGDSQLFEHKQIPYVNWLPFFTIALTAKVTGSIYFSYIFWHFITYATIFIFLYLIAKINFDIQSSIMIGLGVMVGYRFINHIPPINAYLLQGFINDIKLINLEGLNFLSRFLPSGFGFAILAASLFFFQKYFIQKKGSVFLVAFLPSLLFYSYFFQWTFFYTFTGLTSVLLFLTGKPKEKKKNLYFWLLTIIFAIPFAFLYKTSYSLDISKRVTYNYGRYTELVMSLRYLVLFLILLVVVKPFKKKELWFYPLALLSLVICFNIQLVTGFTLLPDHYVILAEPLAFFCVLAIFINIINKFAHKNFFISLILTFFVILGLVLKLKSLTNIPERYFYDEKSVQIYSWLNENTPRNSVIIALDFPLLYTIPAATHNLVFLPNAYHSYATDGEIIRRIFWAYKFLDIKPEFLSEDMNSYQWNYAFFNYKYAFNKRSNLDSYHFPKEIKEKILSTDGTLSIPNAILYIPDNIKEEILSEYASYYYQPYVELQKDFNRKDYLVIKNNRTLPEKAFRLFMINKVYSGNEYSIYELKKPEKAPAG